MTLPIPTPFLRLWPLLAIAGTLLALAGRSTPVRRWARAGLR